MGKAKGRRKGSSLSDPSAGIATRHEFGAGLLGHDFSASQWIVNVSEKTLLGVDVAFACVRLMGDIIAGSDVGDDRELGEPRADELLADMVDDAVSGARS